MRGQVLRAAWVSWTVAAGLATSPAGELGQRVGHGTPAARSPGEVMVRLELDLPKAQQVGTPRPINLPHLDRTPLESVPPLLMPLGSHNLAKGKSITASDAFPMVGELGMVTDGDKAGQDGSYVELGPGRQWVQIDLGVESEVFAVVPWFFHGEQRAMHDVVVQVSDDPEFRDGGMVLFNNDHDNSSGLGEGKDLAWIETHRGKVIDARGARCRYVRVSTNGSTTDEMNRFTEVEVYGRSNLIELRLSLPKPNWEMNGPCPIKLANLEPVEERERMPLSVPRDAKNVAFGMPAEVSDAPFLGRPEMVTDGNKESDEGSYLDLGPGKQWVQIDLGQIYEVFAIAVWFHEGRARAYLDVVVRVSDDAHFVENVTTIYNNDHDNSSGLGIGRDLAYVETFRGRVIDAKGVRAQFVRVQTNGNTFDGRNHFAEVEVYGRGVE